MRVRVAEDDTSIVGVLRAAALPPGTGAPDLLGIPGDFIIFGAILLGVALFHRHTLLVSLVGLATLVTYKLLFTGFNTGAGFQGLALHLQHEWVILANLLGLLLGFALLSKHFEASHIPAVLPRFLPHDWKGAFVLLVQQQRHSPIVKDALADPGIDWPRVGVVLFILAGAIATNVVVNLRFNHLSDAFPFIGFAVLLAVCLTAGVRKPDWSVLPEAFRGSVFLLSLILCASLMPVESLPAASWQTAFGLGFVSAVFDNIPLTALALKQGGYDWGFLAYVVGFGGSMIWFGSSAGVALSNMFPEAKSVGRWLRYGWHVAVAYVISGLAARAPPGNTPAVNAVSCPRHDTCRRNSLRTDRSDCKRPRPTRTDRVILGS